MKNTLSLSKFTGTTLELSTDGRVDAWGNVILRDNMASSLEKIPLNFGEVIGDFKLTICEKLGSLKGAPHTVKGSFSCLASGIESLHDSPQVVRKNFSCDSNSNLLSLEGAPREVGGNFSCSYNPKLTSLEGAPREVNDFSCSHNPKLTSLDGSPAEVEGSFYCRNNASLTSLEGASQIVKRSFFCDNNPNLISLEGGPREVGGTFCCTDNPKLKSLKGAPQAEIYEFDRETIDSREVELHDYDIELFKKWLTSEMSIGDFLQKRRGQMTGKKFGI